MRSWKVSTILTLAAALGAWGCGSKTSSAGVTITISPTIASVITNTPQVFSATVTGNSNTAVTWTLACATGVTAGTCGTIDTNGLYTAPATVPTIPPTTSGGTPTIAPTVTITGTAQADTKKTATATLTIVTGISITITPTTATVGTLETFPFSAVVNNPGCNITSAPTCKDVTWSVPASTTTYDPGTICAKAGLPTCSTPGLYTAPKSVPTPSTVIVTATSVADTSVTATATVTVVTATVPTVTSVSPNTTALGGLFQDIYITGTNFISTENVFINPNTPNSIQLAPSLVSEVSSSLIRARIPDYILAVPPPSNKLVIGVAEQTGTGGIQPCKDASKCEISVIAVRPGVVGPTPDSIPQGTATVQSFSVDGGFFGEGANPAVSATYNGQIRGIQPPNDATKKTRQISVTIGGSLNSSDFTVPGLYPVAIKNATDSTKMAVANLAVQPNYNSGSSIANVTTLTTSNGIGTSPSDVAINPATGMAVVANTGSNSISLIDLTASTPTVVATLCTNVEHTAAPCPASPASGPTSVSVDYVRNKALVVNSTSKTIAIVDLQIRDVTLISLNLNPVPTAAADTPDAVGINPVTGQALVAMQRSNSGSGYGILMDMDPTPAIKGVVSISTGPKTRVAIEPNLNWAIATPGGLGSVGIVDLNLRASNTITSISRTSNVVQVTVQSDATLPPLAIQRSDAVRIENVAVSVNGTPDTTLNGIFTVTAIGPSSAQFSYTQTGSPQPDFATASTGGTISYSQPVSTVGLSLGVQGIGINTETQQAVLVDPTTGGVVTLFNLIDQSSSTLTMKTNGVADKNGPTAVAYNPLTNTAVAVDFVSGALSVIDPAGTPPRRLNDGNLSFGLNGPVAIAIDPGTNLAVVANQTGNSVSILSLGSIKPFSITETSPKVCLTTSSVNCFSNPSSPTLTVIGKGLTCVNGSTNLRVRLDGVGQETHCSGDGDRQLTATVMSSLLLSARRFALDVEDGSGNVTNAEDFTVEQSVDLSTTACTAPEPSGVAIDPQHDLAIVSMFGCESVALITVSTDQVKIVNVGSNPMGVAVIPRLQEFVVANSGSGNAMFFGEDGSAKSPNTVATGSGPMGAAADEAAGEFAIANSLGNTVTVVNAATGGASNISTGQGPTAVAFNYVNHQIAVAASTGNSLGISGGTGGSVSQSFSVALPTSVIYDPVPTDCGSNNNGATTNTTGCFIVNSSTGNSVNIVDPVNSAQTGFRMGINPTAIAYNYLTSTLVSTNSASRTVTVADLLGQKIRAVLTLPPPTSGNSNLAISLAIAGTLQYALDIQPFTNVAVIADTPNGRVLFIPLPH